MRRARETVYSSTARRGVTSAATQGNVWTAPLSVRLISTISTRGGFGSGSASPPAAPGAPEIGRRRLGGGQPPAVVRVHFPVGAQLHGVAPQRVYGPQEQPEPLRLQFSLFVQVGEQQVAALRGRIDLDPRLSLVELPGDQHLLDLLEVVALLLFIRVVHEDVEPADQLLGERLIDQAHVLVEPAELERPVEPVL